MFNMIPRLHIRTGSSSFFLRNGFSHLSCCESTSNLLELIVIDFLGNGIFDFGHCFFLLIICRALPLRLTSIHTCVRKKYCTQKEKFSG